MSDNYNQYKASNCVACGHNGSIYPLDIDHVKTRGSGGGNEPFNCMTLCRKCHTLKGAKGISWMANNFLNYKQWLIENNWEYCQLMRRWIHAK